MGNGITLIQNCVGINDEKNEKNISINNNNYPVKVDLKNVNVIHVDASIEKSATKIEETVCVLKYRTPQFRASAKVCVSDLKKGQEIQIGWIQACSHMEFINTYSDYGRTSWEFPELVTGNNTMISDSDGKQYPWYGSKSEVVTLRGPIKSEQFTVSMNDHFFPQVTWSVPTGKDSHPSLTRIHRKQKFYTWLVLKDMIHNQYQVLKTVKWGVDLNISVNPTMPVGKRAVQTEPIIQKQPMVQSSNKSIPLCALQQPNANSAQVLIWRPASSKPKVVIPPVHSDHTIAMDTYLRDTYLSDHISRQP